MVTPPIANALSPSVWDVAPEPHWGNVQQPEPELEFDQRVAW